MKAKRAMWFLALLVGALAFVAAGCGGDDGGGGGDVEALPSSSCTAIEYEGDGEPDYLIASDLPLQGASRLQSLQINAAIRQELKNREWKAGDYNIGFQACDDATAQAAKWDSGKCSQNANAYAANDKLVGLVGTFNSGCAAIIIPVLNQAPDGGIAMVSPANTYPCLTVNLPGGCESTEPDKYYPSGTRNYARVAPSDDYQGAAVAEYAQSKGVKSVYILNDREAYGLGVATTFRKAAESLGIKVAGFEAWDGKAASYESLFNKVKGTDADAVFLGGVVDNNGGQLIKDKVSVLGPNNGAVQLYAPDGFTTSATVTDAGPAVADMYLSVAGVPTDEFEGAALDFIDSLLAGELAGDTIDPYAIYGGQAAIVLLDAIANSDGSRTDIITQVFDTSITDGLIGSFDINDNGDPENASGAVVGFTINKASGDAYNASAEVIVPKPETVEAAGAA